MNENLIDELNNDHHLMRFYYENEKWDNLDYYIAEIISSNNLSRMRGILTLFKSFKDDPMFKDTFNQIVSLIESHTGSKIY